MRRNLYDHYTPTETVSVQNHPVSEVEGITDKVTTHTSVALSYPYVNIPSDTSMLVSSWTMLRNILVDKSTGFQVVCTDMNKFLGYLPHSSIPMFLKLLNFPNDTHIGYFNTDKPLKVSDLWAFS